MIKRTIVFFSTLFLMSFSCLIYAGAESDIQPYYFRILSVGATCSKIGSYQIKGEASAEMDDHYIGNYVTVEASLQKKSGNDWVNVVSWTASSTGYETVARKTNSVFTNGTYRIYGRITVRENPGTDVVDEGVAISPEQIVINCW